MTEEIKLLNEFVVYKYDYRGVTCTIHQVHSPKMTNNGFASYIIVYEEFYIKNRERILASEWNGGITFFEKKITTSIDTFPPHDEKCTSISYKIGHDYMHLWDTERHVNIDLVKRDLKTIIDFILDGEK